MLYIENKISKKLYIKTLTLVLFLFSYLVKLGETFSLGVLPTFILFVFFIIAYIPNFNSKIKLHLGDYIIFSYFTYITASFFWAIDSGIALGYIKHIFIYAIVPYITIRFISFDTREYKALVLIVLLFCPVVILWIVMAIGFENIFFQFRIGTERFNPVAIGYSFSIIYLISLSGYILFTEKKIIFLSLLSLALSLAVVVLTGSRASLLGISILTFITFMHYSLINFKILIIIVILIAVVMSVIPYLDPVMLSARFTDIGESSSAVERMSAYRFGLKLFQENILFGAGIGSFDVLYNNYPHNIIIENLANLGLVGLLLFSMIVFFIFYSFIINIIKKEKDPKFFISSILVFAIIVRMFSFNLGNLKTLFIFLAIYIVYDKSRKKGYIGNE